MTTNKQTYLKTSPIRKILYGIVLSSAPWIVVFFLLLRGSQLDSLSTITIISFVVITWLLVLISVLHRLTNHWNSLANILQSFRHEDYSIIARQFSPDDSLGLVYYELNRFAQELGAEKKQSAESKHLLQRVLENVNVAIFLFDDQQQLVMVNKEGASLLGQTQEKLLHKNIQELDLEFAYLAADTTTHEHAFPTKKGQWLVKHSTYRDAGVRHSILFLADISHNLKQEERTAWQRLIRILSHEINNAIAPLTTTTDSLKRLINKEAINEPLKSNLNEGLDIIDRRAHNLRRHVNSYSDISRLPNPIMMPMKVEATFQRVKEIFNDQNIEVVDNCKLTIHADESQLEQVLVNLIKNALEASPKDAAPISLRCHSSNTQLRIEVEDHGKGVENTKNLFIPFFTTKKDGSGIGLFISMQIIQAHGGTLSLENKHGSPGCIATIALPLSAP